ncbi:Cupredoxin [Sporodiniella umbellata]|nr:Cupredoxin [Sporodiniella umbellata]
MIRKFISILFIFLGAVQAGINVYTSTQYKMDRGTVRYYDLNVTQGHINPDCSPYAHPVLLINGQMPGPPIIADQGDMIEITVRNQIKGPQKVAIHFHGIRQYGSNHADGVPFLTQFPVKPGDSYVHKFRVVNQAGTYFYHAHIGLQEETVFGPIVIYESKDTRPENLTPEEELDLEGPIRQLEAGPFKYDFERTIMLSEWWHQGRMSMEDFVKGPKFSMIPEANSVLINGRTLHNDSKISLPQCEGYEVISVLPNKVYRLRVVGATAFRTLAFGIAGHSMTIIEIDGELIKPYEVDQLEVTPGQRFSVLVHTDNKPGDYSMETIRAWSDGVPKPTNGLGVLRYHTANSLKDAVLEPPERRADLDETEIQNWIWPKIEPLYGVDPVVRRPASRTIKLRTVEARSPHGLSRFFVNDVAFMEESSNQRPILYDVLTQRRNLPDVFARSTSGFDSYLGTYPLAHYEIIDLVIQSTYYPGSPCRSHPWHTHGHSHWEIAYGEGEYDEERDGQTRNIPRPIQKDVTLIYPAIDEELSEGADSNVALGCGWSKIRIIADNPGIWAVHCHNTFHMLLGMMVVLEEAPELITNNSLIDFQNYPL